MSSPICIQQERESVFLPVVPIIVWLIIGIIPPYITCPFPNPVAVFRGMKWTDGLSLGQLLHFETGTWGLYPQNPVGTRDSQERGG